MSRANIFTDEAGNFDFSRGSGASRYFVITTVTMDEDCDAPQRLLQLRRELLWRDIHPVTADFHATEEAQVVRDHVFAELQQCDFRIDATLWEKPKVVPALAASQERFYKAAVYYHFRELVRRVSDPGDRLLVAVASLGTRRRRTSYASALDAVMRHTAREREYRLGFWNASSDPGLWVADYCSWAIQRLWERGDNRSHRLIASKIQSEFEFTRRSSTSYY